MAADSASVAWQDAFLSVDAAFKIMSLLSRNERALSGRLICREAARRFDGTFVSFSQPLPAYVLTTPWCTESAGTMQVLSLGDKMQLPSAAAISGSEVNVEFALQLLEAQVFPELLMTLSPNKARDSSAGVVRDAFGRLLVASGLAHMLPSLVQRCPGLLDPASTLEAAARYCDLAGLQAAVDAFQPHLKRLAEQKGSPCFATKGMMIAAAGSSHPDAVNKMQLLYDNGGPYLLGPNAFLAAAAGGDEQWLWMMDRGHPFNNSNSVAEVLRHGSTELVMWFEEVGYLPAHGDPRWRRAEAAAAAAACGSVAKLQWLAGRGLELGREEAMEAAARAGNLEALQLLAAAWRARNGHDTTLPDKLLQAAASSGSVPTASWLRQQGLPLSAPLYEAAFAGGDLPMLRWLLEGECPRGWLGLSDAVGLWLTRTSAATKRLVEALQLLAEAGWPWQVAGADPFTRAASMRAGYGVWLALSKLLPMYNEHIPEPAVRMAAATGCEDTLQLVLDASLAEQRGSIFDTWYVAAASNGDRPTLAYLQQLQAPIGSGVLAAAVKQGAPLTALKWLVEQGASCTDAARSLTPLLDMLPHIYGGVEEEWQPVASWIQRLPEPDVQERSRARGEEPGELQRAEVIRWLLRPLRLTDA